MHDTNSTQSITSTVIIRVTPRYDHMISWGILWTGFFIAASLGAWQVWKEYRLLKKQRQQELTGDVEQAINEAGISTADLTRCMFRRLLVLAMIFRLISIPIMIWSYPLWWQFVGDTFPEMVFCSAWTLLVSFFAQLVGIAAGTGTNTIPGVVILATSFVVYIGLVILQLFNSVAPVLLYALLCCIYAALLGTISYFCPRLISLLKPNWDRPPPPPPPPPPTSSSGQQQQQQPQQSSPGGSAYAAGRQLAFRLTLCTVVCIFVFMAHAFGFARMVISVPTTVYWWWNYGALELAPAIMFLLIMSPSFNKQHHHHSASSGMPSSSSRAGGGNSGSGGAAAAVMGQSPEQLLHHHHHHPHHPPHGGGGGSVANSAGSSPVAPGHAQETGLLATAKRAVAAATQSIGVGGGGGGATSTGSNNNYTGAIKRVDSTGSANTSNSRGGGGGGGAGGTGPGGGRMSVGSSISSITAAHLGGGGTGGALSGGAAGAGTAGVAGTAAAQESTSFLRSGGGNSSNVAGYGAAAATGGVNH